MKHLKICTQSLSPVARDYKMNYGSRDVAGCLDERRRGARADGEVKMTGTRAQRVALSS